MSSEKPLQELEIDRTPLDIILIGDRENTGVPWLETIVDTKTRAIVRCTITVEADKDAPNVLIR